MTRSRKNPRADRAAAQVSGAVRPRFDLATKPSMSSRHRRDPRAETLSQRVSGAARLRLDRSQAGVARAAEAPAAFTTPAAKAPPKPVIVENPEFLVLLAPDMAGGRLGEHDRQLFGAAHALAGKAGAVVALVEAGADEFGPAGADRVALASSPAGYDPQARANTIAAAMRALDPRHVLFPETPEGGDLARRVAVLTGERLFTDVEQVTAAAIARPARGRRIEQRAAPTRLITLAPDSAPAYAGAPREARHEPVEIAPEAAATAGGVLSAERIPADPATVPLGLADFVTSAGNGVTDLDTFRKLVAALGATPGASRVLCDAGLMPRDSQVGASGTVLAATCYFALGIAGAPQHLQGVADCEHIIAVNTDLHAAMVARAGLAIIQDAQAVMPALLEALKREAQA